MKSMKAENTSMNLSENRSERECDPKPLLAKLYPAFILIAGGLALSAIASGAESLSLDAYLSQVEKGNQNLQSAREASEGAGLRASESALMYSPTLFAEAQWVNDHETNAMFQVYDKYRSDSYTLGVMQQTPFGLQAKLSYNLMNVDYIGKQPRFWEGTPKIELSQSLWRNGFGSETRAQNELAEAGALATKYSESFRAKATRAEAEGAYIRLAAARQLITTFKNSLEQANDMLAWSKRRTNLNLGENSDLFQAEANLEARKLSLQSAQDNERAAARDFNRIRNVDSDEVAETLVLPELKNAKIPERAQIRDDVRAAQEGTRVAAAQAQLGKERNRPTLEVYGAYALNSREPTATGAYKRSLDSDRPTSAFGVRFQTPLFIGAQNDAVKGYGKERDAAERLSQQKLFEQEIEWKDLTLKLEEAKKRYAIAEKLADIQKRKVENERRQLKRGRTTTYQTLIFDQDFNQAEAGRIQSQSEVLEILARMKTFGGN